MSNKRIEQLVKVIDQNPSIARNLRGCIENPTHLKLSVYYSLGGYNYWNGNNDKRGYYLSVTPERRGEQERGFVTALLGSGVKYFLLECSRQTAKQQAIATTIACEMAPTVLNYCYEQYGISYEIPDEFFPNEEKRAPEPVKKPAKKQETPPPPPPVHGMKLLTAEIIRKLEKHLLGSQEGKGDEAEVIVKFFGGGAATWLVTEGSVQEDGDWEFFGKVTLFGDEWEWGYFRLSELAEMKFPPFGLGVERDMYLGNHKKVGELCNE